MVNPSATVAARHMPGVRTDPYKRCGGDLQSPLRFRAVCRSQAKRAGQWKAGGRKSLGSRGRGRAPEDPSNARERRLGGGDTLAVAERPADHRVGADRAEVRPDCHIGVLGRQRRVKAGGTEAAEEADLIRQAGAGAPGTTEALEERTRPGATAKRSRRMVVVAQADADDDVGSHV